MLRRIFICLLFAAPVAVHTQTTESSLPKNFGRIVEIATPSGVLDHYHNLIGYDSAGLVRQASYENAYKIFGSIPAQSDLNLYMNTNNRFGSPSSHDCYEIRFGDDSSRYWINTALAPDKLPFAVYNTGPRAADNPDVTGGIKLCLRVQDDDGNGIYTPGERLFAFGDLALPIDSSYEDTISQNPVFPFSNSRYYFSTLRTGLASIPYTATSFTVPGDGTLPLNGTVIRLIAQTADTSLPFVYMPDSVVAATSRRYAYPFSYYSYEPPSLVQLLNAPPGMSISGDSIIWQVEASQLGTEHNVILQMTNGAGSTQKPFTAKAYAVYPEIQTVCGGIHPDSLYNAIEHLQNQVTRFALAPNRRDVAEWIKNKFIQIGYPTARLDSFYTNLQWPFNSGTYYPQWNYNVIAELPGTVEPDSVYILGGHHDAILYPYSQGDPFVSAPGADDNASGTVAAIEVARVFKQFNYQPRHTIKFITFATEEFGLYGSKDYALKARTVNERIRMMINNDMIATCQNPVSYWRANLQGYTNSESVTNLAKRSLEQYTTLKGYSANQSNSSGSDSRSFFDKDYKTIFLAEYQFSPFYHSNSDVLANCNMDYMAEMVKISCAMLMLENGTDITVHAKEEEKPVYSFALAQNFPNPFNPSTTIRYTLPESGKVSLKIYNTLGQEVRTLVNAAQNAGQQAVIWDGKNNSGQSVGSGIYFYRLETGKFSKSHKMMLVR